MATFRFSELTSKYFSSEVMTLLLFSPSRSEPCCFLCNSGAYKQQEKIKYTDTFKTCIQLHMPCGNIRFIQSTVFSSSFRRRSFVVRGLFSSSKLHRSNTGFSFLEYGDVQICCLRTDDVHCSPVRREPCCCLCNCGADVVRSWGNVAADRRRSP